MPYAAEELYAQLGLGEVFESATFDDTAWGGLVAGAKVGPARPVFPRIQELAVDDETLLHLGSSYTPENSENQSKVNSMSLEQTQSTPSEPTEVQTELPPGTPLPPPTLGCRSRRVHHD